MIAPVVVVVNMIKPFTHASPRYGELRRGSCKRLFYCPYDAAVPHTIESIYMDGVGENIGQRITPLTTLADCVRGTAQDGGTW